MTRLRIERSSEFNNKAKEFELYLNGDKIGTIANGETKEFDLESGKYQLMAKIDWCQSQTLEFELLANETKTIKLAGFIFGNAIMPVIGSLFLGYYVLRAMYDMDLTFLIIIGAALFLYPMYFITFGRKRYIRIKELK